MVTTVYFRKNVRRQSRCHLG